MPFDYNTNINAVRQALVDHNTVTASPDLSAGLTHRVKTIKIFDPEITAQKMSTYPAVYVRLITKDEEYTSLGATGSAGNKKQAEVAYDVMGYYLREGIVKQQEDLLNEIYNLAENVEGVFQAEFRLSNTALWCNPQTTDFSPPISGGEDTWVKSMRVELKAMYHFR